MPQPQPLRFTSSTASEAQRVTLDAEGLTLESRDLIHQWSPTRRVFWDEVQAVYVWTAPDWTLPVLAILPALLLLAYGWFFAPGSVQPWFWTLAAAAVIAAASSIGIRVRPRRWYRVQSSQPVVQFHTRRKEVLPVLLARLDVIPGAAASE